MRTLVAGTGLALAGVCTAQVQGPHSGLGLSYSDWLLSGFPTHGSLIHHLLPLAVVFLLV